jgi:SAM-dependent methyltransferase
MVDKEDQTNKKKNYKGYVGPAYEYDLMGGRQFNLLFNLGLRENATVLDFGCGSLRLGRLLINWLNKNNYYGIDPNKWLIDNAIENEIGKEIIKIKNPKFSYNNDFESNIFNEKFNFIIAQSIFSHTTLPLFKSSLINFKNSLKKDGIICFTLVTSKIHGNENIDKNKDKKWLYPGCCVMDFDEIIKFTNSIGFCTDIKGYHSKQTWFVFGNNKKIIDIIKNNKNNLNDLPLRKNILWDYSKLNFRKI